MGIAQTLKKFKLGSSATEDKGLIDEVNALELDTSLLSAKLRAYQVFGARYILKQKHVLLVSHGTGSGYVLQAQRLFGGGEWT